MHVCVASIRSTDSSELCVCTCVHMYTCVCPCTHVQPLPEAQTARSSEHVHVRTRVWLLPGAHFGALGRHCLRKCGAGVAKVVRGQSWDPTAGAGSKPSREHGALPRAALPSRERGAAISAHSVHPWGRRNPKCPLKSPGPSLGPSRMLIRQPPFPVSATASFLSLATENSNRETERGQSLEGPFSRES